MTSRCLFLGAEDAKARSCPMVNAAAERVLSRAETRNMDIEMEGQIQETAQILNRF